MRLFKVTLLQTYGLPCDCCVVTARISADIFAKRETEAEEALIHWNGLGTMKIESFEDGGEVKEVDHPGVKINTAKEIFRGEYYNSPTYAR